MIANTQAPFWIRISRVEFKVGDVKPAQVIALFPDWVPMFSYSKRSQAYMFIIFTCGAMENFQLLSPVLVDSISETGAWPSIFFLTLFSNSHMCCHSCEPKSYTTIFHSVVPTPAQLAQLGNFLEMKSLGSHSKPTESDTLNKAQQSLFNKPSGWFWRALHLRITVLELFFHKNHLECLSKIHYLVSWFSTRECSTEHLQLNNRKTNDPI